MSAQRGGQRGLPSRSTRPSRRSSASPAARKNHSTAKPAPAAGGGGGGARHDESCASSPNVSPGDSVAGRRSPAAPGSPQKTRSPQKLVKAPSSSSPDPGTKGPPKKSNIVNKTPPATPSRRPRPAVPLQALEESSEHAHLHHHPVPHEADRSSPQQTSNRGKQKRRVLQHQGSSSDLSKSRGASADNPALSPHPLGETSSDQSRGSTPDCQPQQQRRLPLVKQSSSSDDDKFDILWRLRPEDGRKASPLAGALRQDMAAPHTAPPFPSPKLAGTGRQYSLDSILSPEKPPMSLKSMLTLCRGGGGAGGRRGAKLRRQDLRVAEEGETLGPNGAGAWPSLTVTQSSPVDLAPSTSPDNSRNNLQVKSHSLDCDSVSDWEAQLLQVLDANAASATSSPATTPDGRRPSLLRRLKSLSRVGRQKAVNDDYAKGNSSSASWSGGRRRCWSPGEAVPHGSRPPAGVLPRDGSPQPIGTRPLRGVPAMPCGSSLRGSCRGRGPAMSVRISPRLCFKAVQPRALCYPPPAPPSPLSSPPECHVTTSITGLGEGEGEGERAINQGSQRGIQVLDSE